MRDSETQGDVGAENTVCICGGEKTARQRRLFRAEQEWDLHVNKGFSGAVNC